MWGGRGVDWFDQSQSYLEGMLVAGQSRVAKSKALEIAIPDIPLTQAQKDALDTEKSYAKTLHVKIIIAVV